MPFLGKQPAEVALTTGDLGDDIVTEAKMANDAIGLTELKAGTDGEIISWDASGDPVAIGVGSSGHFLKSQGAGSQPVFAAAGGAWNVIGTSVASSSASLTITGLDSTYDTYAIAVSDAHPATDGVAGWLRLGDSSGIDSGASDYGWGQLGLAINNTAIALIGSEDSSDAQIDITSASDADVGNAASEGMGGLYFLHAPGDGAIRSIITGQTTYINESGAFFGFSVFGGMTSVITLDRVSFLFSSGNIASGRLTVWGLAHA